MRDYNRELFKKTLDSYWAAVEKAFDISPFFDLDGSGCGPLDILSGRIRATVPAKKIVHKATSVFVHTSTLMEYGRPLEVSPNSHTWKHDFVRVVFRAEFPWTAYTYKFGEVHEDGTRIPAGENEYRRNLILSFPKINKGLGKWKSNYAELLELAENCSPQVKENFVEKLRLANNDAEEWANAINSRPTVELT